MGDSIEERHNYVLNRARELARTGNFRDYLGIEEKLVSQGWVEAMGWLAKDAIRNELRSLCNQAQTKRRKLVHHHATLAAE